MEDRQALSKEQKTTGRLERRELLAESSEYPLPGSFCIGEDSSDFSQRKGSSRNEVWRSKSATAAGSGPSRPNRRRLMAPFQRGQVHIC